MPYNLVLNSSCNLSCDYCFAKELLSKNYFISLDNIAYIINFLKLSNKNVISLMGGEPTLHPDIITIIEKLRNEGFAISLKSNGLWSNSVNEYLSDISEKEIYVLLNLNHPSSYSKEQLERLYNNLENVKKQKLVLSINIDKTDFDYEYILEYAKIFNVKYIRWSFAHPIFEKTKKSINQNYFPINNYKSVSNRIVEFVEKANQLGIMTLGDHSVIRCMFSHLQLEEIQRNNGEINTKCEGTIDILPDLQVIYCLPMNSLFKKVYLNKFNSMDDLEMFFESRIDSLRQRSLPFDECKDCTHRLNNECHGGCLAHRRFSEDLLEGFNMDWNYNNLKGEKVNISNYVQLVKDNGDSLIISDKSKVKVSDFVFDFLKKIQHNHSIDNTIKELEIDLSLYGNEIDELLEKCKNYKILVLSHEESTI